MTALDNPNLSNNSNNKGVSSGSQKGSRLSLRGQKRALSNDISPAPEPRTSHRIRTNSSSDNSSDGSKGSSNSRSKNSAAVASHSPAYRAAQLGLRRQPASSSSSSSSSGSNSSTPAQSLSTGGNDTAVGGAGVAGGRVPGVCPLANLGNTCFLNSVLYALRFLPGFTHDLHHLHTHLQASRCEGDESVQHRVQFLSELHDVFVQLGKEERSISDARRLPALQPYLFLQALRVVNPMFEGNRQQDAHELLHCLLDQLCHLPQDLVKRGAAGAQQQSAAGNISAAISAQLPAQQLRDHSAALATTSSLSPPHKRARRRSERIQAQEEDHNKAVDVVGSKFVGRMCLETCCSECEKVTGREETFLEVCVPVKTKADFDDEEPPSETEVFMSALCEEECLQGNNKYWCDACSHHNEARRSVHYPQLPHHLLIHVKRFSAYSRNMYTSKCSEAMPAPLQLSCFCRSCIGLQLLQQQQSLDNSCQASNSHTSSKVRGASTRKSNSSKMLNNGDKVDSVTQHLPYHLSAMVCHLGASLSSGHYLTYVRVSSQLSSSCPEQHHQQHLFNNTPTVASVGHPNHHHHQTPLAASLSCVNDSNNSNSSSSSSNSCHSSSSAAGLNNSNTSTSTGGGSNSSSSSAASVTSECTWLKCCALRLEQVLPQLSSSALTNGVLNDNDHKGSSSKHNSKSGVGHTDSKTSSRNNRNNNSKQQSANCNGKVSNSGPTSPAPSAANSLWLECDDEKIKLVSAVEVVERMRGTLITPYLLFYSRLGSSNSSS